jgi:hypothetical protein
LKRSSLLIFALLSGAAAAVLHASMILFTPLSALLFYLAPLPLFIAGLSQGWSAAAAGGVIGALTLGGLWGPKSGLFFFLATAVGPIFLSRLALVSRPAQGPASEGEAIGGGAQWYPEGRLLLWAAAMAGALLTLVILAFGPDAESFKSTLKQAAGHMTRPLAANIPAERQGEFQRFLDLLVLLAPAASAAAWLIAMTINLRLASRITVASGMSLRPWAPFSSLAFPRSSGLALAAACGLSLMPGTAGLFGMVFAAPLLTAFAILGLAVIHHLLLGHGARVPLLAGLYGALILMSWILVVPLIALGLAELGLNLRARFKPLPPVKHRN